MVRARTHYDGSLKTWRALGTAFFLTLALSLTGCNRETSALVAPGFVGLQLEAEDGVLDSSLAPQEYSSDPIGGGRIINDQSAQGGRAVILLGTNDAVRFKIPANFVPANYNITLVGRGEAYQGWPIVALENVARRRMATVTLDTAGYERRNFGDYPLRPNQELFLTFTNDLYQGRGKDRNAVVDHIILRPSNDLSKIMFDPPIYTYQLVGDIVLSVKSIDPNYHIAKVEFFAVRMSDYLLEFKIGETRQVPYTFVWREPPSGLFYLLAVATDNQGTISSFGTSIQPNDYTND